MDIKNIPSEELINELKRRENTFLKKDKPVRLYHIDFSPLIFICESYISQLQNDEYGPDENFEYYIFESAISCIFGMSVWKWINKKNNIEE